jgi:hypothetical protein
MRDRMGDLLLMSPCSGSRAGEAKDCCQLMGKSGSRPAALILPPTPDSAPGPVGVVGVADCGQVNAPPPRGGGGGIGKAQTGIAAAATAAAPPAPRPRPGPSAGEPPDAKRAAGRRGSVSRAGSKRKASSGDEAILRPRPPPAPRPRPRPSADAERAAGPGREGSMAGSKRGVNMPSDADDSGPRGKRGINTGEAAARGGARRCVSRRRGSRARGGSSGGVGCVPLPRHLSKSYPSTALFGREATGAGQVDAQPFGSGRTRRPVVGRRGREASHVVSPLTLHAGKERHCGSNESPGRIVRDICPYRLPPRTQSIFGRQTMLSVPAQY